MFLMAGRGRIFEDLNQLRQAVTEFGSDFIRGIRQPVPQAPGQLRIPFTPPRAAGGKFQSPYGPRISPADVDARRAIQERESVVDVMRDNERLRNLPVNLGPSRKTPGQLSIPVTPPRSPSPAPASISEQLLNSDPGTYKSIQDIARRASAYYKTPISVEDLMSTRGLGVIDDIEASMGRGIPSRPGALMVRPPGGELTEYQRRAFSQMPEPSARGASMDEGIDVPLAEYQRRALNPAAQTGDRGYSTDDFIKEYQRRAFSQMPEPSARGSSMDDAVDVATQVRNGAGGLRTADLGKLASLGLLGTLVGGGLITQMNRPSGPRTQAPGPQDNLDLEEIGRPAPQGNPPPPGRGDDPVIDYGSLTLPGQMGAGPVTIRSYGARDEALNEARQNAGLPPERTKPQADMLAYYQQREAYAADQSNKNKIMSELASLDSRYSSPDIQAWANANPELAYELINKTKRSQSLVNQQMPQREKIATPITQMGSDTNKNAVGNARMAGVLASLNDQGAYDLENATTPYYPMEISNPGTFYR